jgi:3',5'-cyclic AMP phosphodiesterase CpdA
MRIAHFSDVHLLSLKGARWIDFFSKRWIGGLNLLTSRSRHHHAAIFDAMVEDFNRGGVDHLIATGDITNVALESEFAYARTKFDAIDLGPGEVTVIPGNHDAYVEKGREHFEAYFVDYFRSDAGFDEDHSWPSVRIRGHVAVIALSTSLQTPWFTCWGRVGDDQLARLEAVLSDPRLAGKLRVVAIHHPPAGERARRKNRGLRDQSDFAAILERAGAELVLHGHEHEDLYEELAGPDGPIPVRGIQSATYEAGRPALRARYRIYEVAEVGARRPAVVGETIKVWNPSAGAFEVETAEVAQVAEPA